MQTKTLTRFPWHRSRDRHFPMESYRQRLWGGSVSKKRDFPMKKYRDKDFDDGALWIELQYFQRSTFENITSYFSLRQWNYNMLKLTQVWFRLCTLTKSFKLKQKKEDFRKIRTMICFLMLLFHPWKWVMCSPKMFGNKITITYAISPKQIHTK